MEPVTALCKGKLELSYLLGISLPNMLLYFTVLNKYMEIKNKGEALLHDKMQRIINKLNQKHGEQSMPLDPKET